ncbi:MAG TPA: flagellar FlbD family protein [Bacteroidota bacterium]|nr:flagellar FlbD family protein [Bacteroidota bacterium]
MLELTRLHGEKITINVNLIEFIESTPDTMISTTTGKKIMVKESVGDVVRKAINYHRKCQFPFAKKFAQR